MEIRLGDRAEGANDAFAEQSADPSMLLGLAKARQFEAGNVIADRPGLKGPGEEKLPQAVPAAIDRDVVQRVGGDERFLLSNVI